MFNCTRIHDVGYYDDQAAEAARMSDSSGATLAYYGDNEVDLPGVFCKIQHSAPGAESPFRSLKTGAIADPTIIRRLADGQDPLTAKPLIKRSKGEGRRKVVGYDLQISAPKAVSVLYALGSPEVRRSVMEAHTRALMRVLRYIEAEGLIITRSGARSKTHAPASEAIASLYTHLLSRALDPQIHTHAVLLNICVRPDGRPGAIDNHRLKQYGGAIAALYRCELASALRSDLGLVVERDGRNFNLPIVREDIIHLFSKRREAIVAAAEESGFDTATNRSRAQTASFETRAAKKKNLSLADLTTDWQQQATNAGFDYVTALGLIKPKGDQDRAAIPLAPSSPIDTHALIARIFSNTAMHTWPQIVCAVAEDLQLAATADAALAAAEAIRSSLIAVDTTMEGDAIYTSPSLVRAEHEMLQLAYRGRGSWHGVRSSDVSSVLERDASLSSEQREAIAHALGTDAVVAVEGPPGTGKSFMSAAIANVAAAAGMSLRVTSTSWQATHVVRRDAGIPADRGSALTPFLRRLDTGKVTLSERDIVIVDEAGMAGLDQVGALTRHCRQAGAKLILIGDTRQLPPVSGGAPMQSLTRLLDYGALHTIRRQELEWMRQASMDMSSGRAARAIDTYDAAGAITVQADSDKTLAAAADDYLNGLAAADEGFSAAMRRQLLITNRNDDVAKLNLMVREGLRRQDALGPEEVVVKAYRRNVRDGAPVEIKLSRGDRIIFGERVELGSVTLYNADVASVTLIEARADGPVVTFALDRLAADGKPISFTSRWSDLVSLSRSGSMPIAQHAYATTVHSSQGATVDRTVVAMTTAMNAEPLFVAMTRHRKALSMHVDANLSPSTNVTASVALSRSGRLRGTDEALDDNEIKAITPSQREAVIAVLRGLVTRSSKTDNPSRYVSDIKGWIAADDGVAAFRRELDVRKTAAPFKARLLNLMKSGRPLSLRSTDPLALSPIECRRLDSVQISLQQLGQGLGLAFGPSRLRHPQTNEHLLFEGDEPRWSAAQSRRLTNANAWGEHVVVQIAIALLRKPVRVARAIVRGAFRLASLNPLAAAFARRTGRPIAEPRPNLRRDGNESAPPAHSVLARRAVADECEEDDDRERYDDFLVLAAQAIQELHRGRAEASQFKERHDRRNDHEGAERAREDNTLGPSVPLATSIAPSSSPAAHAKPSGHHAPPYETASDLMSRISAVRRQQEDDDDEEERERQATLLAAAAHVLSRSPPFPALGPDRDNQGLERQNEKRRTVAAVDPGSAEKQVLVSAIVTSARSDAITAAPDATDSDRPPVAPGDRDADWLRPAVASKTPGGSQALRQRASSKAEIAARVSNKMVERGIDPATLRPSSLTGDAATPEGSKRQQRRDGHELLPRLPRTVDERSERARVAPRDSTQARLHNDRTGPAKALPLQPAPVASRPPNEQAKHILRKDSDKGRV